MKPNGNILFLSHDGFYLAEIEGGIRAAHQDGRKADFINGTTAAEQLHSAYLHDDGDDLRKSVVAALEGNQQ